jgi:hypothetical protein
MQKTTVSKNPTLPRLNLQISSKNTTFRAQNSKKTVLFASFDTFLVRKLKKE